MHACRLSGSLLLIAISVGSIFAGTEPAATYDSLVTSARRLAAEGSWSQASEAYAEALPLAPDSAQHQWCELWREDATWRGETQPDDWQARQTWETRHRTAFDRLLEPYANGQVKDDFWAAATEARGSFLGHIRRWLAFDDWYKVAAFLGDQPNSTAANNRLMEFLHRVFDVDLVKPWQLNGIDRFFPLMARGIETAGTPDERAWCALFLAEYQRGKTVQQANDWKRAMELATGTRWMPLTHALEFLWRTGRGWNPAAATGSAVDVPALLREAASLRAGMGQASMDTLSADATKLLQQFEERNSAPALVVRMQYQFAPGETPSLAYGAAGFDRLEVGIFKHTPESRGRWKLGTNKAPIETVAKPFSSWEILLPPAAALRWKSEVARFPQALAPGLYTVVVSGRGGTDQGTQRVDFVVSEIRGVAVADDSGKRELYLYQQGSGQPAARRRAVGVVVSSDSVQSWSGSTDEAGRIELPRARASSRRWSEVQIVADVEGQPVEVTEFGPNDVPPRNLMADFFLDRPVYRPGEVARWKVIVRERHNGLWTIPDDGLDLAISLNNETLYEDKDLVLSRFGTAHGEVTIPAAVRPGEARVKLRSVKDKSWISGGRRLFGVDNFVLPALGAKVVLASGSDSLRPGGEMVARVSANYLSGGPTVGARVQLKLGIYREREDAAEPWQMAQFNEWIEKSRAEIREAVTDASGTTDFHLRFLEQIPGMLRLRLDATVLPEGGQAVHAEADWRVTNTGRLIEADVENSAKLVPPGCKTNFECVVRDGAGEPATFSGKAQMVERRWIGLYLNPEGQIVDHMPDAVGRAFQPSRERTASIGSWTILHSGYVETIVAEKPVEVSTDGQMRVDFIPSRAGLYRLRLIGAGGEVTLGRGTMPWMDPPLCIVVADEKTRSLALDPSTAGVYAPERIRVGEPLKAFVVLPQSETAAIVAVAGEAEIVSRRVDLPGHVGMISFDRLPRCMGRGSLTIAPLVWEQRQANTKFRVDEDHDLLRVELTSDPQSPRPGETSRIQLSVHPGNGKKTQEEVAIAVSDESLNGLIGRPEDEGVAFAKARAMATASFGTSPNEPVWIPKVLRDSRPGAVVLFGQGGEWIENPTDDDEPVEGVRGVLAGEQTQSLNLLFPEVLDPARTKATLQLSPGHASAILDALPYLVDYPYGCVEQTMSRFLPAIVVRKTLIDAGFDALALEQRILLHEEKADKTRREATAGPRRLDEVTEKSLARLAEAQRADGGFGWWPGADSTDLWMTAYVAWGLNLAEASGISVPPRLASRTKEALMRSLPSAEAGDSRLAWAVAALAQCSPPESQSPKDILGAYSRLYVGREKLSPAGRACLVLAAAKLGTSEQRAVLLRNLENGAEQVHSNDLGDTVHWGSTGGYWRALDGAVESTSLTLLALLEVDPKHRFVEPAANWLLLNRRSAHWASTRDTAIAVLALAKYVALRGEFAPDAEVKVLLNEKALRQVKLTRKSFLLGPTNLELDPHSLQPGKNLIELQRVSGATPVYAVALVSAWAAADVVKPAGNLMTAVREFAREKAVPTVMGTLKVTSEMLSNPGKTKVGEQVMARVTLTLPNEMEYLMVEVPRPAGCEPLNSLSGWDARILQVEANQGVSLADALVKESPAILPINHEQDENTDTGRPVYREEHDDRSVFFLDHLTAGTWEIRFGLRATTQGDYRALPVQASAMYVPEVRANSDARRVQIDPQDPGPPARSQ